jgi:glycosyltransferase involved in cell wall biosynthesis
MRILSQIASLQRSGGIEVNTLESVRALTARGHDVHLLYGPDFAGVEGAGMRPDFEAAGVTLHGPFDMASSVRGAPMAVRRSLSAGAYAARLAPDVLWLQRFEQIIWGHAVATRSGTPLVVHLHHPPNLGRALPLLSRGVSRYIAVSEYIRQQYVAAGAPERLVEVVHNAVPPQLYREGGVPERDAARAALGLPAGTRTALFYGRLAEDKGLETALSAWERLAPGVDEAHLVLAGEFLPAPPPGLSARIDRLVAAGTLTLLPAQRDVLPLLHAADLVVFPTIMVEAFGRVALEALMTGRPVLASHNGGVPEVLSGPMSRFLVPTGDAPALAAGLRDLLGWRTTEPELGRQCAAHAHEHFPFAAYTDQVERVLQEAADTRRTRRRRPSAGRGPAATSVPA